MSRTPRPWTVLPHGPTQKLVENLWVVEGKVPTPGGIQRRMAVLRREDEATAALRSRGQGVS